MKENRVIVVSNRLPVTVEIGEDGLDLRPSCGGLVSALAPILRDNGGCWIGSTGAAHADGVEQALSNWGVAQSYSILPVFFTEAEQICFYHGYSNEILWPLFHSLPSRCKFGSGYWNAYWKANEKFAKAVEAVSRTGDFVWVHDYHLMLLADLLRSRGAGYRLAYFHHIPFPPPEIFENLPWRKEVLYALTRFDRLGFQTARDRRNFVACVRRCLPDVRVYRMSDQLLIRVGDHSVVVGNYPISVDYQDLSAEAISPYVIAAMKAIQQGISQGSMVLGVDRLDYTKGIPERLTAFQALLDFHPELMRHVTMVQIVVPSREQIPEYQELKVRIEMLVSKINGEYGCPGWVPIHYLHRCVSRAELLAYYRAADVALVTPLKDGMNLVAKEFCASRVDNHGVLVLSEFAGAAEELSNGALLVNPYDSQGVASAIFRALAMSDFEQQQRMENMRSQIREHDVFRWASLFRADSIALGVQPSRETCNVLRYVAS